ncbi:hypothetical protein [Chryseobacterium sp. MA9]|uniref:hypothetical protein n=1 Tax=Chryseobacterium sp. MA9 TaxID=2966625 RepID=UPI0021060562|nr:hypothetical protein [Chryseobacterium sp. MA9]UTX48150.1 hypothetical protein KIK00_19900 [Chryseobacterium sp. MA9]
MNRVMEDLKKLNIEFENYLDEISVPLTEDLIHLLEGKGINYLSGNTQSDIKAFYFEYEFEYLNIIFWGVNSKGKIETETISLPAKKNKNDDEKWTALIPEEIWQKASDFQDDYEEDDFDEILDEYNDEKYRLFEQWFITCWKKASEQTNIQMDAYFSIHDSYFKTDLNTLKTLNEDEIDQRFE